MAETVVNDRRRWFRFSLRSLIVVVSVAVLVLSHGLTSYRLYRSDSELAKLRRETGYLEISDPSKIHVVAAPTMESKVHRWRVYLPPGVSYRLTCQSNDIPIEGVPLRGGSMTLEPGEWMIELQVREDSHEEWSVSHFARSATHTSRETEPMTDDDADWLSGSWITMTRQSGTEGTESVDVGKSVVLLRQRSDKNGVGTAYPYVTRGVMLWLKP